MELLPALVPAASHVSEYRVVAPAQAAVAAALGDSPAAVAAAATDGVTAESATAPALEVLSVNQAPSGVPSTALIQVPPGLSHASVLSTVTTSPQVIVHTHQLPSNS